MKNLLTFTLPFSIALLAIAIFFFGSMIQAHPQVARADSGFPNIFPLSTTTPPFAINKNVALTGGSSVQVLATSTARLFAYLSSASSTVFCNLSDVPATLGGGFVIGSSSSPFKIDINALYTGSIQCISQSNGSLSVSAYQ